MCVSDIHLMLDLPQSNISQHLMILRNSGVVSTRREGKQIYYMLTHPNFIQASDLVREILIEKYQDSSLADELTYKMKDLVPLVHDPICNMRLSPKTAAYSHKHQKKLYYFCASGCLKKFKEEPEAYVRK